MPTFLQDFRHSLRLLIKESRIRSERHPLRLALLPVSPSSDGFIERAHQHSFACIFRSPRVR
jgi:hypothetical protein